MSTIFSATAASPFSPPTKGGTALHQRFSWRVVGSPWRLAELWAERRSQRRALGDLAELNDHLLNDVGLTREQAVREAGKPFWRM